jgi:RND family efflux transporter MFP subunit
MFQPKKLFALFLSLTFILLLVSCSSDKKNEETKNDNSAAVFVTVSNPSINSDKSIITSGQVESSQTANISTRVMGYITKINVKVGDHVSKGQLLASISNEDILSKRAQVDAMIAEAEAAYKNAQKDLDRFTTLYKQQSASAKELDNITLQYNSVKSKLEAAKQMRSEVNATLAYTHLTAPFAGIVTQKMVDAGSMANPGMPILTIEQNGNLQIAANISETDIQNIQLNDEVIVDIKSLNKSFHSIINQIYPSSQFTGGQYIVKINIPENAKTQLYSGMYVNVNIPLKHKTDNAQATVNGVMVPVSSIINKDQLTGIYTISNDNTALLRWVRLGKTFGSNVEILSGLSSNEQYIVSADGKLFNGAAVKIKK